MKFEFMFHRINYIKNKSIEVAGYSNREKSCQLEIRMFIVLSLKKT